MRHRRASRSGWILPIAAASCGVIVFLRFFLPPNLPSMAASLGDESWLWFLGIMSREGLHLGVDAFFTYGPLAQVWTAYQVGDAFHAMGWILFLSLLFAGAVVFLMGLYYSRLHAGPRPNSLGSDLPPLLAFVLLPAYQRGGHLPIHDLLVLLALWMLLLHLDDPRSRRSCLWILWSWALLFPLLKLPVGLYAFGGWVLGMIAARAAGEGSRFLAIQALSYPLAFSLMFLALTGEWDPIPYLSIGFKTSATYSEIMVLDSSFPWLAAIDVILLLLFLHLSTLRIGSAVRLPSVRWTAALFFLMTAFYLYKHSVVRMQTHLFLLSNTILFALVLLTSLDPSRGASARGRAFRISLPWIFLLLMVLSNWTTHIFGAEHHQPLGKSYHKNLSGYFSQCAARIEETLLWASNPQAYLETHESRQKETLERRYPGTIARLRALRSSFPVGDRPTITFAPWAYLISQTVPEYRCVASPSLQIYESTAHPELNRMDRRFLEGPDAPDVIVLGCESLDRRNSVSEFDPWLEALFARYESLGTYDGCQTILRKHRRAGCEIRRSLRGGGSFLRIRIDPLSPAQETWFRIGTLLYRSPQLGLFLDLEDADGTRFTTASRVFYSQLKTGAYYSDIPVGSLLGSCRNPDPRNLLIRDMMLVRERGFPASLFFPDHVTLRYEYCRIHPRSP